MQIPAGAETFYYAGVWVCYFAFSCQIWQHGPRHVAEQLQIYMQQERPRIVGKLLISEFKFV